MQRTTEVYVDESGRLFIPEELRSKLGILPETTVTVEEADGGGVWLRLHSGRPTLVDKEGVWVIKGELNDDLTDVIQRERERRLSSLLTGRALQ